MALIASRWAVAAAVAAFACAAPHAAARTPAPQQTPTTTTAANPATNAQQHLMDARRSLNAVLNAPAPTNEAFAKLNEIKTHYLELEKAFSSGGDWQTPFEAINRVLNEIIDTADVATTPNPAPTGTSGRAVKPQSRASFGAAAITSLRDFRRHLGLFRDAQVASKAPAVPPAAPPPAAPPPAAPPPPEPATPPTAVGTSGVTDITLTNIDARLANLIQIVDQMLAASPAAASVSVDRTLLDNLKAQIEQIRQDLKGVKR